MAKNTGWGDKKNLAANELRQHAPMGLRFFWVLDFCCFPMCHHEVPTVFTSSSQ